MKVNGGVPTGPAETRGLGIHQAEVADRGDRTHLAGSISGSDGDRIELSNMAGQIARAERLYFAHRARRVEELEGLYRSGSYQVDTLEVGRRIVAEALAVRSMLGAEY